MKNCVSRQVFGLLTGNPFIMHGLAAAVGIALLVGPAAAESEGMFHGSGTTVGRYDQRDGFPSRTKPVTFEQESPRMMTEAPPPPGMGERGPVVQRVDTMDGPICYLTRVANMEEQMRLAQERIAAGQIASPQPTLEREAAYAADGVEDTETSGTATTTAEVAEGEVPLEASMTEEERIAAFECLMPQLYQGYMRSPHGLVHVFQDWDMLTDVPFYSGGMGGRYVHVYANERTTFESLTLFEDRDLLAGSTLAAPSFSLRSDGMILPGPLMFVEKINRGFTFGLGNWRYTKVAHNGYVEAVTRGRAADKIDICVECTETPADQLYKGLLNNGVEPPLPEKPAAAPASVDDGGIGDADTLAPLDDSGAPVGSLDPTLDPNAPLAPLDPTLAPSAPLDPAVDPLAPLDGSSSLLDPALDPNAPLAPLEPALDPNAPLAPSLDPNAPLAPALEPVEDTTTALPPPDPTPPAPEPEVAVPQLEPAPKPDNGLTLTVPDAGSASDSGITVTDEDELILSPENLEAGEDELLLDN